MGLLSPKKRVGRIQRGVRRVFIVDPHRAWTTRALMEWTHTLPLYQGKTSHRERHNHCLLSERCVWGGMAGRQGGGYGRAATLWRAKNNPFEITPCLSETKKNASVGRST
jgi:hypothetical protein